MLSAGGNKTQCVGRGIRAGVCMNMSTRISSHCAHDQLFFDTDTQHLFLLDDEMISHPHFGAAELSWLCASWCAEGELRGGIITMTTTSLPHGCWAAKQLSFH